MRKLIAVLSLLALPCATADAQHPHTRQGFGISVGLGSGSAGISCDGCGTDRESALSGNLRLGGYLRPSFFLGAETNGWVRSADGVDETTGFLSAVAQWYPALDNGFFLKGGVGYARADASDGFDEIATSGMGISLGTGYDLRLMRNFSLTPYVNYLRSFGGELQANGLNTDFTTNIDLLQFGLGFTWH